jgi:hypothetical protein
MTVGPVMPSATAWAADQDAADGYLRDDCISNLASNELQEEGQGAQKNPSAVQTEVNKLFSDYNTAVSTHKINGQLIKNPDVVTMSQLTAMATLDPPKPAAGPAAKAATSAAAPAEGPFIGPLPINTPRPMVYESGPKKGQIVPGSGK